MQSLRAPSPRDYSVVAQQGIGIICGWQPHTMLETYEMTCYQRNRRDDWNFIRQPDFVVINLGSNDIDKIEENGKTPEDVQAGAVRLSQIIRSHYPAAGIVWAMGMIGQQLCPYLPRGRRGAWRRREPLLLFTAGKRYGRRRKSSESGRTAAQRGTVI